ncbi:MAG: kelch repeat-containing protein [Solirubrobacteraceae bacterium]
MPELDGFESRFAVAYRRYLDEAPTAVDAAALARTVVTARPFGRWGLRPVGLRPARALVWLVLLALLLAALLAAAVVVGSRPASIGFACPAGSTPAQAGQVGQPRPPLSYVAPMAFDRHAGRIVLLALGYAAASPQTWTFDVCTNTWTRMWPSQEPTTGMDRLVYDVDSDVTITLDAVTGRVWAYDLAANRWTAKSVAPMAIEHRPSLVYDPVSGLIVGQVFTGSTDAQLWTYDVDTDTWHQIRQAGAPTAFRDTARELYAYDASVDRILAYNVSSATWLIDAGTGTWSNSDASTPVVNLGWGATGGEIAYDEVTKQTVVFGDGKVIAYDAAAERWETIVDGAGFGGAASGRTARLLHSMVYDPVNDRFVVYGGEYRLSPGGATWVQADDVLAFDLATRQWTVLLEAFQVLPAP